MISEVVMRVCPTVKPKSWLLALSAGLLLVNQGIAILGSIFVKLSGLLDMVGQNIKE